jgi:hypothetical protein
MPESGFCLACSFALGSRHVGLEMLTGVLEVSVGSMNIFVRLICVETMDGCTYNKSKILHFVGTRWIEFNHFTSCHPCR